MNKQQILNILTLFILGILIRYCVNEYYNNLLPYMLIFLTIDNNYSDLKTKLDINSILYMDNNGSNSNNSVKNKSISYSSENIKTNLDVIASLI